MQIRLSTLTGEFHLHTRSSGWKREKCTYPYEGSWGGTQKYRTHSTSRICAHMNWRVRLIFTYWNVCENKIWYQRVQLYGGCFWKVEQAKLHWKKNTSPFLRCNKFWIILLSNFVNWALSNVSRDSSLNKSLAFKARPCNTCLQHWKRSTTIWITGNGGDFQACSVISCRVVHEIYFV